MEDLLEDIQVQRELGQGKNVDFWQDRTTISENEIVIRPPTPNLVDSGKGQATP